MKAVLGIIDAIYYMAKESGIYIFIGFFFAGIFKAYMKKDIIRQFIGENKLSSVIKAALFGIPLPLCSCSVIPIAASLKKEGASKGAVSAFLISTPETGVDSIALTYALLGPVFTVMRPLSALMTSIIAGIAQNLFYSTHLSNEKSDPQTKSLSCLGKSCSDTNQEDVYEQNVSGQMKKLMSGLKYSFTDLLPDIGKYLAYGFIISGVITYFIPNQLLANMSEHSVLSMLIMLIISVPIYTCATGSTPIALALLLKGLNPGAALVFLLAGPATNIVTISAVGKILGKRELIIYLLSICITSILFGLLLDYTYQFFSIKPLEEISRNKQFIPEWLKEIFAWLLIGSLGYILRGEFNWISKKLTRKKSG